MARCTTALITPGGGTLDSASGNVNLNFPPGSVTSDTLITHTPAASSPTGGLVGVSFSQLTAEHRSDGAPVTSFDPPCTLHADHTDAQKESAIESTLGLYWWDGGQWQLEPTSSVNEAQNRVTASVSSMTRFHRPVREDGNASAAHAGGVKGVAPPIPVGS
jgi:hypothetical protein